MKAPSDGVRTEEIKERAVEDKRAGARDVDVLIVGAGPTGLTAANVLAREGTSFRIIDGKSGPVEETRALVVHAKTLELLDKLGLATEAVEEGQRLGAARFLSEGKPVGEVTFFEDGQDDRTPYPFALVYEQHRMERLLIRGLERAGGRVEWDTRLLAMEQVEDGVSAAVRDSHGSEETIEAGWVIGADGARSLVRHSLGLEFEGDTYEQTLFLADVEMEWEFGSRQVYVDMTKAGFYAFLPMPGEKRFRLIGSVPEELEERAEITEADVQSLLDAHSGIRVRITRVRWTSLYSTHRRMTEHFRVGDAFLAGDAAHIHSPAGGQGMNTGIGDAYNLAWKLALVAGGEAREALLDSYEAERVPFARSILNGSDRGFSLQVTTNPATQRLKLTLVPLLLRFASALPVLRRRLFWLISQLWTSYRNSPAVARSGTLLKGPRAGERAPYGIFEDGSSLYRSLAGTVHHLLVFEGEKTRGSEPYREEITALLNRYAVRVEIHYVAKNNRSLHRLYGAREPSLFLVRPDGHIAFRGGVRGAGGLAAYLDRTFKGIGDSIVIR